MGEMEARCPTICHDLYFLCSWIHVRHYFSLADLLLMYLVGGDVSSFFARSALCFFLIMTPVLIHRCALWDGKPGFMLKRII